MPNPIIQKVKEANDIVEVVGEQVNLKRAGSRWKGLSPFTQEKTASFFVNPETQLFYCFSTNRGGDVIAFVMQTKGMDFGEALRWLADRGKVALPKSSFAGVAEEQANKEANKIQLKVNQHAAYFFQQQFWSSLGAGAQAYALKRGLTEKTLKNFVIGFAPEGWQALRDYLMNIQAPLTVAVELGLLKTRNDEAPRADGANLYDAFRNRLIFPIRDAQGDVVGFGGRALGADEKIKYLNSPESAVFNKGQMLYNFDRARKHIRDLDEVVLVEGYMDCVALEQVGVPNVVATLGTALTPTHVGILRKTCRRIVNFYDADSAGKAASLRNMDLFLTEAGIPVAGVNLPVGKDPDEFIQARGEAALPELRELIRNAPALIDSWIETVVQAAPKTVQGRADAAQEIVGKLALLKEDIWIRARTPTIAERLMISAKVLDDGVAKVKRAGVASAKVGPREPRAANNSAAPAPAEGTKRLPENQKSEYKDRSGPALRQGFEFEFEFLRDILQYPERLVELRARFGANPEAVLHWVVDEWVGKVLKFLLSTNTGNSEESAKVASNALLESELMGLLAPNQKSFILRSLAQQGSDLPPPPSLNELVVRLERDSRAREINSLQQQIRQAEASGDEESLPLLQQNLVKLVKEQRQPRAETRE